MARTARCGETVIEDRRKGGESTGVVSYYRQFETELNFGAIFE